MTTDDAASVLVVEGDDIMRQVMRIALRAAGLHVVGATGSGAAALRLRDQHQPKVVVLDVGIPGPDGSSLLAHLKTAQSRIWVIVVTNGADGARRHRTRGADGVITRPFAPSKLVETVRQCLARAPRPHAA